MKLTIEQFKTLVATSEITRHFDIIDTVTGRDEDHLDKVWGYLWNTLLFGDGAEITYQESFDHPVSKPSQATSSRDIPDSWVMQGFSLVDDDGDELDQNDIADMVEEVRPEITEIDLSLLGDDEYEEIDIDVETDMEEITIERDNAADLKFKGEVVGIASSSANNSSSYYSGSVGRWTVLTLYKTAGGKLIAHSVGKTQWQGEHDRHSAAVCATEADVIAFFGHGWLAKDLYADAGISDVETVD